MKRILLIEDEDVILKALTRLLERNHYDVSVATTVEAASELQPSSFDLVLADLRLPGEPGTAIIPQADPAPVIIMTSHASVRSAVDAMRSGAIDYIAKPFDHDELLMVIGRSLMQKQLHAQNRALRLDIDRVTSMSFYLDHPITERIQHTVASNSSGCHWHIHGEPGTQREQFARALHRRSERSDAPFVVFDASLVDSQQAGNRLSDYMQIARNGTLAIRHPESLDSAALTLLVEFMRAEEKPSPHQSLTNTLDVALITLSASSLDALANDGKLGAQVLTLFTDEFYITPLRQRRQDVLPLAQQTISRVASQQGKPTPTLSDEAMTILEAHDWPGNATELEQRVQIAVSQSSNNVIEASDIGFDDTGDKTGALSLDEYFRYAVLRHQSRLSETELAALLGISRKALWERRQKMHLLRDPVDR